MRAVQCAVMLCLFSSCGPSQTPPNPNANGAYVATDATDIPIYDEAKSSKPFDPSKYDSSIQDMFEQIDVSEEIEAYKQETGHYPKDYVEFKLGVVDPNGLKFPSKLPMGLEVQYDEANHRIVVVKPKATPKGKGK